MKIMMGDLNAKVGNDNRNYERVMGKEGCGTMNDNGERGYWTSTPPMILSLERSLHTGTSTS